MSTIKSKQLIGRFIQNYGIENTDFVYMLPQLIEDAIGIMNLPKFYVSKRHIIKIDNHKGEIPCDVDNIFGFFIVNNNKAGCRLIIRNNPLIGRDIQMQADASNYGDIDGNELHTTFKKGEVLVVYKDMPRDSEGVPLIPNNPKFFQAIEFYFVMRLTLRGFKHPILDFDRALMLWEQHYPRAANSVNWFDLQDYQEFTELWTNSIVGDLQSLKYIH